MKRPIKFQLRICGGVFECEKVESNYYYGYIEAYANTVDSPVIGLHVEVLSVDRLGNAKNAAYQNRIDAWCQRNNNCEPSLLRIRGLGLCFIHVEVPIEKDWRLPLSPQSAYRRVK